jgi:hypothetical protein
LRVNNYGYGGVVGTSCWPEGDSSVLVGAGFGVKVGGARTTGKSMISKEISSVDRAIHPV